MIEEFKIIEGYPNYRISNFGRIQTRLSLGRKIVPWYDRKQNTNNCGYKRISISNEKGRCFKLVHRLVGLHFINNPNNYPQINHKDGNKTNNNINNLEWCNGSQNIKHAYNKKLLLKRYGENHAMAKLDDLKVLTIKTLLRAGWESNKIAKHYNVHKSTISKIKLGTRWGHIQMGATI